MTALPQPCGELSAGLSETLRKPTGTPLPRPAGASGRDLHLALHTCYALHYHGFDDVDAGWEWDPGLLGLRAELEKRFLDDLHDHTPGGSDLETELETLLTVYTGEPGLSDYLRDEAGPEQMREYLIHRSILHHQEADPYAWLIPRLRGQAKAALVAVEFDEFGGGRGERIHQQLYADLLAGAGLNPAYLHYLDVVPAEMLALVNMMSLFCLHRRLRGAGAGHFAAVEITSSPASRKLLEGLERMDADPACRLFYREHVEADAVHEQLMRRDVLGDLLANEPELRESVVFGIQATTLLEDRFAAHVLGCWRQGRSSLLGAPGGDGSAIDPPLDD